MGVTRQRGVTQHTVLQPRPPRFRACRSTLHRGAPNRGMLCGRPPPPPKETHTATKPNAAFRSGLPSPLLSSPRSQLCGSQYKRAFHCRGEKSESSHCGAIQCPIEPRSEGSRPHRPTCPYGFTTSLPGKPTHSPVLWAGGSWFCATGRLRQADLDREAQT